MKSSTVRAALLSTSLFWAGCQTPEPVDYTAFVEYMPRSILVLPPLDESPETNACYGALSTVTRPLAECGYYVFPVALVDLMMRENGLPTSYEMHQVSLEKLKEIFDPDAVLYLKVTDWGTSYQVINSQTTVTMEGRLVDATTGTELWSGAASAVKGSGDGGGGLAGILAAAVVNQVVTSISDPSRDISKRANQSLFSNSRNGLLMGRYHPDHEASVAEATADP